MININLVNIVHVKNGNESLMREVVEAAVGQRAKIVATGEWETSARVIPNPVESLDTYSGVSARPLKDKIFMRMRDRIEVALRPFAYYKIIQYADY